VLGLPERELQICHRLRAFREVLKIPRTTFALTIGIGGERLASYEAGRAPVRYEVFRRIHSHFRLNPNWLATGATTSPQLDKHLDDTAFSDRLHARALFSEVYDAHLAQFYREKMSDAHRYTDSLIDALKALEQYMSGPGREDRQFITLYAERVVPAIRAALRRASAELKSRHTLQQYLRKTISTKRPKKSR
jgi:hypothetical protein